MLQENNCEKKTREKPRSGRSFIDCLSKIIDCVVCMRVHFSLIFIHIYLIFNTYIRNRKETAVDFFYFIAALCVFIYALREKKNCSSPEWVSVLSSNNSSLCLRTFVSFSWMFYLYNTLYKRQSVLLAM